MSTTISTAQHVELIGLLTLAKHRPEQAADLIEQALSVLLASPTKISAPIASAPIVVKEIPAVSAPSEIAPAAIIPAPAVVKPAAKRGRKPKAKEAAAVSPSLVNAIRGTIGNAATQCRMETWQGIPNSLKEALNMVADIPKSDTQERLQMTLENALEVAIHLKPEQGANLLSIINRAFEVSGRLVA